MDRRGFMSAILAAGVAPAVVRASSLMPVIARVQPIRKGGSVHWVSDRVMTATEVEARREEWLTLTARGSLADNPAIVAWLNRVARQLEEYTDPSQIII